MSAYTYYWENATWDRFPPNAEEPLTYIAGKLRKPFSEIKKGDEIFVVTSKRNRLYVGGRIIANSDPIRKTDAMRLLVGKTLIDKEAYVIADPNFLVNFKGNVSLDAREVRLLEIISKDGKVTSRKFTPTSFPQDFLNANKISESSATRLRDLLSISGTGDSINQDSNIALPRLPALPTGDDLLGLGDDDETRGTGYESDPKIRRAVEQHAVYLARRFYEMRGYSVVEKGKPYDLLCQKPGEVIHVEVKGSRSTLKAILLTTNEVKDARNVNWRSDLFLVDNIILGSRDSGRPRPNANWLPEETDLTPIQYRYKLPPIPEVE